MSGIEGNAKTPKHLWIVGTLSFLWNAMGVFDYLATHLRLEFYVSQFTPEQMEYFTTFPSWAVALWACGVWGAFAGSVGLLLRKGWSLWMFKISLLGAITSSVYNLGVRNGLEVMGTGGAIFSAVIVVVAILLVVYAKKQKANGVLA